MTATTLLLTGLVACLAVAGVFRAVRGSGRPGARHRRPKTPGRIAAPLAGFVPATSAGARRVRGLAAVLGVAVLVVAVWAAGAALRQEPRPDRDTPGVIGTTSGTRPHGPGTTAGQSPESAAVRMEADGWQIVQIVASNRYTPDTVSARAGVPTVLEVLSEEAEGCLRSFVIPAHGVERHLPVDGLTRVNLGTPQAGTLDFGCDTGMAGGRIEFREGT